MNLIGYDTNINTINWTLLKNNVLDLRLKQKVCAGCHVDTYLLHSWGELIQKCDKYGNLKYWHELCYSIYKNYWKL
jgi:hypothetical protein